MWSCFLDAQGPAEERGGTGLFENLSPADRSEVLSEGRPMRVDEGQVLFRQGTRHEGIFIVGSGCIRTFFVSTGGRELTFAFWSRNHLVGTPEIFGRGRHTWSGAAVISSRVVHLEGRQVRDLCRRRPEFAIAIIDALALKGRCFSGAIQMLGTRNASARLAHVILSVHGGGYRSYCERNGVPKDLTHQTLASMVGVTRQWVSVTLQRLQARGLITLNGRQIAVLDEDGLRREAAVA